MKPTFRHLTNRANPLTAEERAHHLFHRLSFSFRESMDRLQREGPDAELSESTCVVLALKASKLLGAQGVKTDLWKFSDHTVARISLNGESRLNTLARGIAKRHHGARLIFDPRERAEQESTGAHADWDNLVAIPDSLLHAAARTGGGEDPTLGHEFRHLQTSTMLRNGVLTPRGITTGRYAPILSGDDAVERADETICVEQDFNRAKNRLIQSRSRNDARLPDDQTAMGHMLSLLERDCGIMVTRALQSARGLSSGPTMIQLGSHFGRDMISASFLYRGKNRELFEMMIPIKQGANEGDQRKQIVAQVEGLIDLAVESHARLREARIFAGNDTLKNLSRVSPSMIRAAKDLKERIRESEIFIVPQAASAAEILGVAQNLVSRLNGPGGFNAALGVMYLYSNPLLLSAEERDALKPAVYRILKEPQIGKELEFTCADTLVTLGDIPTARRLLYKAYADGERSETALNLLALVESMEGGDLKLSLRLGRKITRENPHNICFWDTYGYALFKDGDINRALAAFKAGRKLLDFDDPTTSVDNLEFMQHYGDVLDAAGKRVHATLVRHAATRLAHRDPKRMNDD